MIKAVVFDCFGVLVTDGWLPFKKKYFKSDQIKLETATDLNKAVDAGFISFDEFMSGIAVLAGITNQQARDEIQQNPVDDELFEYIATLKPTYKIGLLSNAGGNWLGDLFTPKQLSEFDATALSCELGVIKPSIEAYEAIADMLGLLTSECLFIDDQERYCAGAIDAGMQAIQFVDTQTLIKRLPTMLEAPHRV